MTDKLTEQLKKEIIKKFTANGLLVTSHGFEEFIKNKSEIEIDNVISTAKDKGVFLISDEFLKEFVEVKEEKPKTKKPEVVIRKGSHIFAKDIEPELNIDPNYDVTDKSTCEGKLEDFVEYFKQKYNGIEKIIRRRPGFTGTIQIKNLRKASGPASIIAMVTEKRESRRGFKFLDVEDPTGDITVLISRDNAELNEIYNRTLLDEVIGINGELRNNLFIAREIVQPDLPITKVPKTTEEPIHAAFLSDFHVGSYLFLEKEFQKFLDWLNLKSGNRREVAEKIKYIFVAGDLVDGIGIYPGQEHELSIPDIYKQYDYLSGFIEQIPDYIEVVMVVGNHDAVRRAEPEPRLDKDIGAPLYEIPNVQVVGNPAMVTAHGIKTLIYHGDSMDGVIGHLGGLSYTEPTKAMTEYLKRRHLAPLYNDISPENKDYMVIRDNDIPDIFHGGHVHANGYGKYRGVHLINAGTWQAQTKYQEQLGHHPTPARVPIMNLSNNNVMMLHFS